MTVSWRNIVVGGVSLVCMAGVATAQNIGGHIVNVPTVSVGAGANTGGNTGSGCCVVPKSQIVNVPGVSVPAPNIVVGGSSATVGVNSTAIGHSSLIGVSGANQGLFIYNGNGVSAPQPYESSVLNNLNVAGGEEYMTKTVTEQQPMTEQVCLPQKASLAARPVQAVCLDDKGAPHPASQTFGEETVAGDYSGEIFRCMAGTSMQVTLGSVESGQSSFDGGQTISCGKGEALVHAPGGALSCAPEAPQRNCNERSLLRRHGPGLKMVQSAVTNACVPSTRTVMKTVTREVKLEKPSGAGRIILDGGVGQGVY